MEKKTLDATVRTDLKKGGSRRLRNEGLIPAVMYGHKEPVHIAVDAHEVNTKFHALSENTIIGLEGLKENHDVLVKDYQEDITTGKIIHIDFLEIEKGKTLRTHVPIHTKGTSEGERMGGQLDVILHEVEVECLPKDLPEIIEVDVSAMSIGDSIHIGDLPEIAGVKILNSSESVVCNVAHIREAILEEPEEAVETEAEEADESAAEASEE
jgi:large subunit ribosomal protein L25